MSGKSANLKEFNTAIQNDLFCSVINLLEKRTHNCNILLLSQEHRNSPQNQAVVLQHFSGVTLYARYLAQFTPLTENQQCQTIKQGTNVSEYPHQYRKLERKKTSMSAHSLPYQSILVRGVRELL